MIERTLVIVKPDAVLRGRIGAVIQRLEDKGLKIIAARFSRLSEATAQKHHAEHSSKSFSSSLVSFITASPVMLMVVEGNRAIESVRNLLGKTNGVEAASGTLRGDFSSSRAFNLVHASDSAPSATREIALFFKKSEICEYALPTQDFLFEQGE